MSKNSKNILSYIISCIMIMIFVVPFLIQAQDTGGTGVPPDATGSGQPPSPPIKIVNPFKENTVEGFIRTIVNDILIPIGAVVAVIMIMYAGFLYVTARGNPGQIEKAHKALLWAVIGAAILLGAWVISQAIQGTINELKK